jgi:hypothetical protein
LLISIFDVSGLGAVEIQIRGGRVRVFALFAFEHAERDQRVEEISHTALVKSEAGPHLVQRQRSLGESREQAQFHRAEQRFGAPVTAAQLHDRIGRHFVCHRVPLQLIGSTARMRACVIAEFATTQRR